jgi:tetratricopeptide (TPR) repeat protein
MTASIQLLDPAALQQAGADALLRPLPVPWRDPHTVSPEKLAEYIATLEKSCQANPQSADLRTCLGMAYAMNFDVYKSFDALEAAIDLDNTHFFAQLKYSELLYRLRALPRAEQETLKALELARNTWEYSIARKQLQEIRRLTREGTQKPEWTKPMAIPVVGFVAMTAIIFAAMAVLR